MGVLETIKNKLKRSDAPAEAEPAKAEPVKAAPKPKKAPAKKKAAAAKPAPTVHNTEIHARKVVVINNGTEPKPAAKAAPKPAKVKAADDDVPDIPVREKKAPAVKVRKPRKKRYRGPKMHDPMPDGPGGGVSKKVIAAPKKVSFFSDPNRAPRTTGGTRSRSRRGHSAAGSSSGSGRSMVQVRQPEYIHVNTRAVGSRPARRRGSGAVRTRVRRSRGSMIRMGKPRMIRVRKPRARRMRRGW